MRSAMAQLNLAALAYAQYDVTASPKLARTIADVAGSDKIESPPLAQALQYHPKLMM